MGIIHETTPPYSHESNGKAERYNRTITTDARTMLQSNKHLKLWPEAILTAVYLRNIKPTNSLPNRITPFEALHGRKPLISHLKRFLLPCLVYILSETRATSAKFNHRAEKALMVGYHGRSSYRLYVPGRDVVMVAKNITWQPDPTTAPTVDMDLPAPVPITTAIDPPPAETAEPKESTTPPLVQLELTTTTPPAKPLDLPSH